MKWSEQLIEEPWRFDMFHILRRLEQSHPDKPRIGDNAATREEIADLGQEPFLAFPPANVSRAARKGQGRMKVTVRFMGLLGGMGPLPLSTTEEAHGWYRRRDEAFAEFLDLFNNRFIKLFYRAWAQPRPAAHYIRPDDDRFRDFVGSVAGIGAPGWRNLDSLDDLDKLDFAGLLGVRQISASRIEDFLEGLFGLGAEVDQYVGSYLELDPDDCPGLGDRDATLGSGMMLGSRVISVDHKIRVRLHVSSLEQYERFLPGGTLGRKLVDAMFATVGDEYEWDVELVMPKRCVRPAQIGTFGRVGLTTWMQDQKDVAAEGVVRTRFSPAAIMGAAR